MKIANIAMNIVLLLGICFCTYTDIKTKKIKNKVTFPLMFIFLIFNTIEGKGLFFSLKGIFIGGLISFILCLGQGLGGGDIKLFSVIGALNGYKFSGTTFVWSLIFTIVIAIIIDKKKFIKGMKNVYNMLKYIILIKKMPKLDAQYSAQTIPYSISILLAYTFNLVLKFYIGGDYICHLLNI